MESANKAIIMAFGMIVAVMILTTIIYVFNHLKAIPQGHDSKEEVEQVAVFNLEYEVYDKKIMYGVDIISVLNKAKSNNEKYVQGKFLSGLGYNTDYIIDIEVRLKQELTEQVTVTYLEETDNGIVEREYISTTPIGSKSIDNIFKEKMPSEEYRKQIWINQNFWSSREFMSTYFSTKVTRGTYHLLAGEHENIIPGEYTNDMIEKPSQLKSLLEYSTEMEQVVKNVSGNKMIVKKEDGSLDTIHTGWNKATWYPAIYELKTRKFKCIGEETIYSEKTGRIIKMVFEEIKK